MLQNRVDPFGNVIKTEVRGTLMGNRGVIHNNKQEIVRAYKLKAWITCKLEFKGRKRQVMAPDRYTELFFLDEATSFSAGHRPCFECRRREFDKFKFFWLKGNPEYDFNEKTSVKEIDNIIHKERINTDNSKITYEEVPDKLPNGTFVVFKKGSYLVWNESMYLWSPFGYGKGIELPDVDKLPVLTPKSVVNALRAGYAPQIGI